MMSFQDARRSNLGDEAKEVRNYFLQQLVRLKSVNIYLTVEISHHSRKKFCVSRK